MGKNNTIDIEFDPEDIILLLIYGFNEYLGKPGLNGTTRLVKLIYLLQNETDYEGVGEFEFEAYNFGPFSKKIYEAIDFLTHIGLVEVKYLLHNSQYEKAGEHQLFLLLSVDELDELDDEIVPERVYCLTSNGYKVAEKLKEANLKKRPKDIDAMKNIILKYGTIPLNQLIRYVYRRYPAMTSNSIHPEAKRI